MRLLLLCCLLFSTAAQAIEQVKIGVLSHRGDETTLRHWTPTADYLSQYLDEYQFVIVPLDFEEIDGAVANQKVDFLLVNPGIYVTMEVRHRISRIATMNNLANGEPINQFGGVIFTSVDNSAIMTLEDLRGRSLMAVDETSLGGFQMAWRELKQAGINPQKDLNLRFEGIHDDVVEAVVSGNVDVGTVRTGILESMADDGRIDLKQVRVIHSKETVDFPFLHSTTLYPEWPFSKLQHTPNELAQRVAIALLSMSHFDVAAQWGDYYGWTIPLEYQPVHELLRDLLLPPYDQVGRFTLTDVVSRYFGWILVISILIITLSSMTIYIYRLHRKLEESKHLLEQQHVQILDSVADGIYGVDLQGNSTFINRAMESLTGWQSHEVIGRNQHEMLHHTRHDGSPHPPEECPVFRTFIESRARFVEDDLFWRKDGSSFPVEYSSNPITNEAGKTVGSVVVFRDISEKKRLQEESRQYQTELAHVARLSTMGEMASGLAHELNQPLTAIATNADACVRLIESGQPQSKVVDALEKISRQARHAGEIIRHLRQLVRKQEPEFKSLDINKLIKDVLLLIRSEINRADINVTFKLDTDLPRVRAQHIHIDQVLLNLIRNALEAMVGQDTNKRIIITTSLTEDKMVRVSIADHGPGLSADVREKLFVPFTTTKEKGMGIGLSLSQGIIQTHRGSLELDYSGCDGTSFSFTLPTHQE